MENTLYKLLIWFEKVGIAFVIGGLIGAIVQRMRKRMTCAKFLRVTVMGMFVGWIIGSVLTEWTNFGDKIIYSACALSGVFAEDLLKECEQIVKKLSEHISNYINNKLNK